MTKTTFVTMRGFVEYAKVFTENMDDNMEFHEKIQGQFNVNFYPKDEVEFAKYFDAGAPQESMGHSAIKNGNSELATGKFLKLKRPNVHPSGIEDFGSAPKVFDFRDGESTKQWEYDVDGEVGNGSEVLAKVSIYGDGPRASIRLEKVAVLSLEVYIPGNTEGGGDKF
tara:strand:- start:1094 stop:1597 length:504 start_codon:yes stop_codon:yes gene_type:complete